MEMGEPGGQDLWVNWNKYSHQELSATLLWKLGVSRIFVEKLDRALEAVLGHQLGPDFVAKLIDIDPMGFRSVFNGKCPSTMAGALNIK